MTTESLPHLSPSDSWADLAEARPSVELEPAPVVEDKKPETPGICPECGEPIVREPGSRGRLPRYHPACKPNKIGGSSTPRTRRTSTAKAEQEADICVAQFKSWVVKGCIMVATVDKYDAFALMVGMTEIQNNLRGVLIKYDKFRKEWLVAQSGGSVVGLALSVVMTLLPILAHHGMFGTGPMANQLHQMPKTLFKIQQQLKNGEENLTAMMAQEYENMRKDTRNARTTTPNPVPNGTVPR